MRVAALFSGGKDSTFSVYYYLNQGWDVCCLVTLQSKRDDSWMFHTPNVHLAALQAKALEIPLLIQETAGEKEEELVDLQKALSRAKKEYAITGVIVGALYSDYQHERVNRICHEIGLKTYAPLWHKNQEQLLRLMVDEGFEIIIQSIAADGFDESWLGQKIDAPMIDKLVALNKKNKIHVAFEGGEAETFVLNGPLFKKKIVITKATKVMESSCCGTYVIEEAVLAKR